jgi:hypothetical protein
VMKSAVMGAAPSATGTQSFRPLSNHDGRAYGWCESEPPFSRDTPFTYTSSSVAPLLIF